MQNINYEQIVGVLGLCIWFVFPFGMFLSVVRQDREALAPPKERDLKLSLEAVTNEDKHLKIFGHKKMLYNDEYEENEVPADDVLDEPSKNELVTEDGDFIHPHQGIGSTHSHHIH